MKTKTENKTEMIPKPKIDKSKYDYTPIEADKSLQRQDYPLFGEVGKVIAAISNITKKDPAMAGQAVISTLAGACQSKYQVHYFDDVGNVPLSLFVLTIAKSGHGKSHVSKLCSKGLQAIQDNLMAQHKRDEAEYERMDKEDKPAKPVNPLFIVQAGTIEGMIDVIQRNGYCYALIDELSVLLGGHSAKPENVMKLLGTVSTLWSSGRHSEVKRGNDNPRDVTGDLTFSANGQPQVVKPIFNDATWREQGTIPRFLVCEPKTRKDKRVRGEKPNPDDIAIVDQFNKITSEIFNATHSENGKYTVIANEEAEGLMTDFYNEMIEASDNGMAEIESYALRATEHTGRLAGLVAVYRHYCEAYPVEAEKRDIEMTKDDLLTGIRLMRYYIHEYKRLSTGDFGEDVTSDALALFDDITHNPDRWQPIDKGYVSQNAFTRNISRLKSAKGKRLHEAFETLIEHGYLFLDTDCTDSRGRKRMRWEINPFI